MKNNSKWKNDSVDSKFRSVVTSLNDVQGSFDP